MLRRLSTAVVLGFVIVGALAGQEGPRPGVLKAIDTETGRLTIRAGDQDLNVEVTDQTIMRDSAGRPIEQRLRSPELKKGAPILFKMESRDGKNLLVGLKLRGANDQVPTGERPNFDSSKLRPLTELGSGDYQGHLGGLYPGGKNTRPATHDAAGLVLAHEVRPLDADGKPDSRGKIVLLSIGMSNTGQASQGFQKALAGDPDKNPALVFVNGAVGGQTASRIQDPNDKATGAKYWAIVDQRLQEAGVTRAQVGAAWIKQADAGPSQGFPAYAKTLEQELVKIVQVLHDRFPNLKLVYLTSRTYGGYALTKLNPEPYAYESGFSVRWLIERQLRGEADLNFDPDKGAIKAPWLSWGPYFWANGSTKRSDGFSYDRADFSEKDGTHLTPAGMEKVGRLMLEFFKNDSTTRPWFLRPANTSSDQRGEAVRVQADLARARAILAQAAGKERLAAEEWRKVVGYCETVDKALKSLIISSGSAEEWGEAEGELAIARARLAELERDRRGLLRELPKVIAYHEGKIRRIAWLVEAGGLSADEARQLEEHERSELRWPISLLEATKSQGAEKKDR